MTIAVPEFWQQFPKALTVDKNEVHVGLFPGDYGDLFELQGGEQKTHTVWFDFQRPNRKKTPHGCGSLSWVFQPAIIRPTGDWCSQSGTIAASPLPDCDASRKLENLLDEALTGKRGFAAKRNEIDEYGWRNYGEIYADHEQAYYQGQKPLISHYNNQFDMVYGFLLQFLRTGDRRWFELGDALARHVIDIDVYHTTEDKAAYNGGLFWFTDHYLHAVTSTHRTYSQANCPQRKRLYGGGPGAQHNFTSGLLLYYCLTGNREARETVIGLADWVVNMDDGRKNILGLVDDGPTGLASVTSDSSSGPGRGAGNSINALLDAWTLTEDRTYLEYAEELIRRCVHPADDVALRDFLDVERQWSYTVFLTSLAKYLDHKVEAGEFDRMYTYGQASLLHYGEWMLDHEKPYFDQVEKLEYPTEAWAAQEFRKANVLRRAALHADEPLRTALLDRGDALGDRAWDDLLRFETRTYARAVAIVMIEGLLDCHFRERKLPPAVCAPGPHQFGSPSSFVPQKQRVLNALRQPRGAFEAAGKLLNPKRWQIVWKNL